MSRPTLPGPIRPTALNPSLRGRLRLAFGDVKTSAEGRRAVFGPPRFIAGKYRSTLSDEGEYYMVNCRWCNDQRYRLYVNHLWGQEDPLTGEPMRHLATCFNAGCLTTHYGAFERRVTGMTGTEARAALKAMALTKAPQIAAAEAPLAPVIPPGVIVPIDQLPVDHAAARYLRDERGFALDALARDWGVGLVLRSDIYLAAAGRIYAPVHKDKALVGWQCRWPGEDYKLRGAPKYYTMPGFAKSRVLYGADRAAGSKHVVVVEGVADAWAVGDGAVALLGKSIAGPQLDLLSGWAAQGALLVLALDPGAWTTEQKDPEAARIKHAILLADLHRRFAGRVVELALPEGRDPASLGRKAVRFLIRDQAAAAGFDPGAYGMGRGYR